MTFPSNPDADPDPTSQIAWPARQGKPARDQDADGQPKTLGEQDRRGSRSSTSRPNGGGKPVPSPSSSEADGSGGKRRMSTWDLFCLSIAMGGSQVAWTVELG